jgi:hypothetical protein
MPTKDHLSSEEYEIDDIGNRKLRKIVYTRSRFEYLELVLRVATAAVVIVGILQLVSTSKEQKEQIESQIRQQKLAFQLGVFEKALPLISQVSSRSIQDSGYRQSNEIFRYEVLPSIGLINDKALESVIDAYGDVLTLRDSLSGLRASVIKTRIWKRKIMNDFERTYKNPQTPRVSTNRYAEYDRLRIWLYFKGQDWFSKLTIYRSYIAACFGPDTANWIFRNVNGFYNTEHYSDRAYMDMEMYNCCREVPSASDTSTSPMSVEQYRASVRTAKLDRPYSDILVQGNIDSVNKLILLRIHQLKDDILSTMKQSNNRLFSGQ